MMAPRSSIVTRAMSVHLPVPAMLIQSYLRRLLAVLYVYALVPAVVAAQPAPAPDTTQAGAIRVFLDCEENGCDFDFFRDQMRWVNFVRDRLFSDVQLLVTTLRTGSGGREYTIAAIGQDRFKGRVDTVVVTTNPNDATDTIRRQLARTFALLLGPYAARTPLAARLDLTYTAPTTGPATPKTVRDPWNFWVYRISGNGFGNGEKRQTFVNGDVNLSANRVTAAWKLGLGATLGYNQSTFTLSDGSSFTNLLRNYGGNALLARSIGGHWAAGLVANGEYADFNNYRLNLTVTPAVEWNLFDYKEFTRRQLTAFYTVGVGTYRYKERTIYDRIAETRPQHALTLAWNARQPWGSVNMSVFGSQFLHDISFNSYGTSAFLDLRITKGLSLNFGGNYARVNDQLYLPRGTLTDNQVIARQQALATNFRYFGYVGLSYTFGSIYNTVVNPRFGRARGSGGGNGMSISF